MSSEDNIVKRVQNGDADAFERLVEAYQGPLFVLARNMTGNGVTAGDIVQDTFLAAFEHIGRFDPRRGRFSTWLFSIARNKCINARNKTVETLGLDLEQVAAPDDVETQCERGILLARLDAALALLPDRDRAVFVLAEIQELPLAEVAAIEGVPVGTVKSRLSRTRSKLRRLL